MAVYVNKMRARYGALTLCHLLADSVDELHAMAARIGLEPMLFNAGKIPHYDLSVAKRDQAIAAGAQVIDRQQLADLIRKYKAARLQE